jgi:hypothetical protein
MGENVNPDSCNWCERIEHGVGAGTLAAGSMLTLGGLLGATLLGQLCQGLQQGAGAAGNGGPRREEGSAVATAGDDTPGEGGSTTTTTDQTTGEGGEERETPEGRYYGGFGRGPTGAEGGQPAAEGGGEAGRPGEVEGAGPRPAVSEGEGGPTEGEPPRLTAEGEPEARPAAGEGETYRPAAPEGGGAPAAGPATDAARDRWNLLNADGEGRVYGPGHQHILNVDADGNITDLSGRPVQQVIQDDISTRIENYVDADGNEVRIGADGQAWRRTDIGGEERFDLPTSPGPRPNMSPEAALRWDLAGAGPNGELYAPDGRIIGHIDANGNMSTVDGRTITGNDTPDGGRLQAFNTDDGQRWTWDDTGEFRSTQLPDGEPFRPMSGDEWRRLDAQRAAQQAPTAAEADAPLRPGAPGPGTDVEGDPGARHISPELQAQQAEGTRPPGDRTIVDEPDLGTRVPASADTKVEGGPARGDGGEGGEARASDVEGGEARASDAEGGEARASDAEGGEARSSSAEGGEVRVTGAEGGEVRPSGAEGGEVRPSGAEGGEVRPSGAEGETRPAGADAEGGSLASSAFSRTMDVKSVQDLYNQHIADGKPPAEALSLAVAQTGAGNVVVDMGIIDPKMSAAAGALLPGGMRNILPEQAIQNWMGTGNDALNAFGESIGASLGSGELDTSAFDRFAEDVANRPGVDPFKGIGQAVEFVTEEVYRNDGGSLVSDLQQIYETGAGADVANEAMSDFQQATERGQYGAPLQGINHLMSGVSEVITDPSTTVGQFFSDAGTILKYGVGDGFWSEAVDTTAEVIKNTPIANTIYDGYHQVFSGVAQQGVTGFASEMAEGASALAGEAYDAAANSLADGANATYKYIKSWF